MDSEGAYCITNPARGYCDDVDGHIGNWYRQKPFNDPLENGECSRKARKTSDVVDVCASRYQALPAVKESRSESPQRRKVADSRKAQVFMQG